MSLRITESSHCLLQWKGVREMAADQFIKNAEIVASEKDAQVQKIREWSKLCENNYLTLKDKGLNPILGISFERKIIPSNEGPLIEGMKVTIDIKNDLYKYPLSEWN